MDAAPLVLAWAAGVALGGVFFGGLWWTVRRCVSSEHPARWLLGSLVVRMSIVLVGLYFVGDGHWERLLACLLGLLTARVVLTRWKGPRELTPDRDAEGVGHAS